MYDVSSLILHLLRVQNMTMHFTVSTTLARQKRSIFAIKEILLPNFVSVHTLLMDTIRKIKQSMNIKAVIIMVVKNVTWISQILVVSEIFIQKLEMSIYAVVQTMYKNWSLFGLMNSETE